MPPTVINAAVTVSLIGAFGSNENKISHRWRERNIALSQLSSLTLNFLSNNGSRFAASPVSFHVVTTEANQKWRAARGLGLFTGDLARKAFGLRRRDTREALHLTKLRREIISGEIA